MKRSLWTTALASIAVFAQVACGSADGDGLPIPGASGGSKTVPGAGGATSLRGAGGATSLPGAGGATSLSGAGGAMSLPGAGGATSLPGAGGATSLPGAGGAMSLPGAGGAMSLPGAGVSTIVLADGGVMLLGDGGILPIDGNGIAKNEQRDIGAFTKLTTAGYRVEASVGSPQSVVVTADENVVPYIETIVKDDELRIGSRSGVLVRPRVDVVVRVTAPQIVAATSVGAPSVDIANVGTDVFEAVVNGVGAFSVRGEANRLNLKVVGAGTCHAEGLRAKAVQVSVIGNGTAEVCATDDLNARVTGPGIITYSCDPKNIESNGLGPNQLVGK